MPDVPLTGANDGGADGGGGANDGTVEAEASDDSGQVFDSTILYADRVLPDVEVASDAPVEAANVGANCPPDLQAVLGPDGGTVPVDAANASLGSLEIPAQYASDNTPEPAPPGSLCAAQVWTTSASCDQCLRTTDWGNAGWVGPFAPAELPPCSDLADAGTATVGPGSGKQRRDLCIALFQCVMKKQCLWGPGHIAGCMCNETQSYCQMHGGDGVCFQEELAAFEADPGITYQAVLNELTQIVPPTSPGHGASSLNQMFADMAIDCRSACEPADAGIDGN